MGSTTIEAPEPRDLGSEAEEIADVNLRYAPKQFAAESTYRPKYAELDRQITYDNMFDEETGILKMGLDAVDMVGAANRGANTLQREADLADATNLGGDQLALQKDLNPEIYDLMTRAEGMAGQGPSTIGARSRNAFAQSLGVDTSAPLPTASFGGDAFAPQAGSPTTVGMPSFGQPGGPAGPMGPQTTAQVAAQNRNRVNLEDVRDVATVNGPTRVQARGVGDVATRGNSEVLQSVSDRALADMELGGALDPASKMMIEQSVLEQMNKMGRAADNRSMAGIAMELDKASQARMNERFGRALQAENALQSQQGMDVATQRGNQVSRLQQAGMDLEAQRANQGADLSTKELNTRIGQGNQDAAIAGGQLKLGESQVNQAADAQYQGGLKDLAMMEEAQRQGDFAQVQQAVGNRLSTLFDPTLGVLGRPSVNNTNFTQQRAAGNFAQTPTGAFDVFNNYAGQLNSQNFGEANENARSQAQMNADMIGGAMGMVGGLASI